MAGRHRVAPHAESVLVMLKLERASRIGGEEDEMGRVEGRERHCGAYKRISAPARGTDEFHTPLIATA